MPEMRFRVMEREDGKSKIVCTMCGKTFSMYDKGFGYNQQDLLIGYPSKHDLERIRLNLCVDCFDKVLDIIIPMCKTNPVVDEDWSEKQKVPENCAELEAKEE